MTNTSNEFALSLETSAPSFANGLDRRLKYQGAPLKLIVDAARMPPALSGGILLLGNFDGFHRGHQALLAEAQRVNACNARPIGVMSCEPHPRSLFAPDGAPFRLTTPDIKTEIFSRYGIDFAYSPAFDRQFASTTPEDFARIVLRDGLCVDHVVAGGDFRFGARRAGDTSTLKELGTRYGFGVSIIRDRDHRGVKCSSSYVRLLLENGRVTEAREVLGHDWSFFATIVQNISGEVEIDIDPSLVKLPEGTYKVKIGRGRFPVGALTSSMRVTADGLYRLPTDALFVGGGQQHIRVTLLARTGSQLRSR